MTYQTKNYHDQGGDNWTINGSLTASSTSIVTLSGTVTMNGTVSFSSGTTLPLAETVTQSSDGTLTLNGTVNGAVGSAITFDNLTVTNLNIATGGRLYDNDGKWDDLMFPAATLRVPGSGGPGAAATVGTLQTLAFDAASRETVYLQAQMPHRWAKGTVLYPHVHYCTTATTGGKVVWGMEYTIADIGSAFVTPTTAMVAASASTLHSIASLGTIATSDYTGPSTMLLVSVFRDSTNSSDTCTTDAHLLQFDIHFLTNSLGSSGPVSQGP